MLATLLVLVSLVLVSLILLTSLLLLASLLIMLLLPLLLRLTLAVADAIAAVGVPWAPAVIRISAVAGVHVITVFLSGLDILSATCVSRFSDFLTGGVLPAFAGVPTAVLLLASPDLPFVSCAAVGLSVVLVLSAITVPGVPSVAIFYALTSCCAVDTLNDVASSLLPLTSLLLLVFPPVLASMLLLASPAFHASVFLPLLPRP